MALPAEQKKRLQFAYRLDTVARESARRPAAVSRQQSVLAGAAEPGARLATRAALRSEGGARDGHQAGRRQGHPDRQGRRHAGRRRSRNIRSVSKVFTNNCPLWTYILAEAMHFQRRRSRFPVTENVTITTPRLGPVGGRIVAEVFLGLMFGDKQLAPEPRSGLAANPGAELRAEGPRQLRARSLTESPPLSAARAAPPRPD